LSRSKATAGGDLLGYRAKTPYAASSSRTDIGAYDPAEFWEDVRSRDGRIILDPECILYLFVQAA